MVWWSAIDTRGEWFDQCAASIRFWHQPSRCRPIQGDKHIELISGDGHITLAACDSADNLIRVESFNNIDEPVYCFAVRGTTGVLQMRIPKVYFIWAGDKALQATVTVKGTQLPPIPVDANDGKPVGAADTANHAVLLKLSVGA